MVNAAARRYVIAFAAIYGLGFTTAASTFSHWLSRSGAALQGIYNNDITAIVTFSMSLCVGVIVGGSTYAFAKLVYDVPRCRWGRGGTASANIVWCY